MLQIVTKIYFRDDVPLHATLHREVLFTNRIFLRGGEVVGLPVGELAPSSGIDPVSNVTISVTEHLEAEDLQGEASVLISTGGQELVDEIADVLSFGLNAVFSRDVDLVRTLVPSTRDESERSEAAKLFRGTFDPSRYVEDSEIEAIRQFMASLISLRRPNFEAAMRAIRRIVRATRRASTDPTAAYVDLVAALESLAEGTDAPAADWSRMDDRKRRLFDGALAGADDELVNRVREAAMEAERVGARSRFSAFVADNVTPAYFRAGAIGTLRPMRGADFERAVKLAYDVRSRNVHVLRDLPPEAWALGDRSDTVSPPGLGVMFSLEGLFRLAREVVANYVRRAPHGIDPEFNWRAALPGQIRVQFAPQYWIWDGSAFDLASVGRYFSGFVGHLMDTLAGREKAVTDMSAVLERIEELLPGTAEGPDKRLMIAIYSLWHRTLAADHHRPDSAALLSRYGGVLEQPEAPSFVVGLLTNQLPDWSAREWENLAIIRRSERETKRHLELPSSLDAAIQVLAAERLMEAGDVEKAQELAAFAVEELPGNPLLIEWESGLVSGRSPDIDLRAVVLGLDPEHDEEASAPEDDGQPPRGPGPGDESPGASDGTDLRSDEGPRERHGEHQK